MKGKSNYGNYLNLDKTYITNLFIELLKFNFDFLQQERGDKPEEA